MISNMHIIMKFLLNFMLMLVSDHNDTTVA